MQLSHLFLDVVDEGLIVILVFFLMLLLAVLLLLGNQNVPVVDLIYFLLHPFRLDLLYLHLVLGQVKLVFILFNYNVLVLQQVFQLLYLNNAFFVLLGVLLPLLNGMVRSLICNLNILV